MRPAMFACLSIAALSACSDQSSRVVFAQVNWMEWPSEVRAAQPFTIRLVGYNAGCGNARFDPGTTVDNSAVTFEPFFLFNGPPIVCPLDIRVTQPGTTPPIFAFFDTRAAVAGLTAQLPRSYEIRAAADVSIPVLASSTFPVRTFGDVVVKTDTVDTSRVNAGGEVQAVRDSAGCVAIFGGGLTEYRVENPPADTVTYWSAFVEGYIYRPAAPVCGDSVVFHLTSRS